jgi:hypothetical protein
LPHDLALTAVKLARQLIQRGVGATRELQLQKFRELAFGGIGHRDPLHFGTRNGLTCCPSVARVQSMGGREGHEVIILSDLFSPWQVIAN